MLNVNLANVTGYAAVVECLFGGPLTVDEIVMATGFHENTVRKFITALRRKKLVRVAVWRKDIIGRYTNAAFKFGSAPDAARPPQKTPTERSAAMRARRRAALLTQEQHEQDQGEDRVEIPTDVVRATGEQRQVPSVPPAHFGAGGTPAARTIRG